MKKLIILVIANRNPIYDEIINIYWKKFIQYANKLNQIRIFLLYDNEDIEFLNDIKENVIKYDEKVSMIPGILKKTISSFEYIDNNYDYDYILRTNISSFFIYDKLLNLVNSFEENNIFSGRICNLNFEEPDKNKINLIFVSGAAFFLSKNLIKNLIMNKNNLLYNIKWKFYTI